MLYQRKTFTLPSGGGNISQRAWDYSTLSREHFLRKYGADAPEYGVKA